MDGPMTNSAVYTTGHRGAVTGLLDEVEHALAFRVPGEAEWISGSSPTEPEPDRTRKATEDTLILVNGFVKIVDWLAADRVRRRRIRGRIQKR